MKREIIEKIAKLEREIRELRGFPSMQFRKRMEIEALQDQYRKLGDE